MYARRAHCPNMQFQLQEELTAQTSNLLLFLSFLCPVNQANHCQTYRPGHESLIQIPNLGNEISFTFALLYSTSHSILSVAF